MILGTFHMENPGRDAVNMRVDDVLAPHRQAELDELASRLARFAPTKICVECPASWQDKLDSWYRAYLDDTAKPWANEIQQVAFRLGRTCGVEHLIAIDDDTPMVWDTLEAYLEENEPRKRRFDDELRDDQAQADRDAEQLLRSTLHDFLAAFNSSEKMRANLAFYIDLVGLGDGGDVGADLAASWYERNLRIFGNIARNTEPTDRIFVLMGAGHVPILRHLAETSSRHEVVDVLAYLV
jgi:hypothetical protein